VDRLPPGDDTLPLSTPPIPSSTLPATKFAILTLRPISQPVNFPYQLLPFVEPLPAHAETGT
jgi:hypothetical protein